MRLGVFDWFLGVAIAALLALYMAQAVELTLFRRQVAEVGEATRQVVERRAELLDAAQLAYLRQ